jgi:TatD DNase family protein
MWIDFHTHQSAGLLPALRLYNLPAGESFTTAPFSIGIHPWWLDHQPLDTLQHWVKEGLRSDSAWALGECGMDKRIATDPSLQRAIAQWHIELAAECRKPLVFHCVKAHNELMQLVHNIRPEVPVIFHGFRGSHALAQSLIDRGFYIGIGLPRPTAAYQQLVRHVPLDRMTLETDDGQEDIAHIYANVAELKRIPIEQLMIAMKQNALAIFGDKIKSVHGS